MKPLFRPGTWDQEIWNAVNGSEYPLPDQFSPDDVIFDVGAHIGAFANACLTRKAGRVFSFEADRANYGLCVHNLAHYGDRARVYHLAVWRSDAAATTLQFSGYGTTPTGAINTGGGNVVWDGVSETPASARKVKTVDLDSLLRSAGKVRLLKLDCESSEFPILLTSQELERVQEIVGEYHEIGGPYNAASIPPAAQVGAREVYDSAVLVACLARAGFSVTTDRAMPGGKPCNLGKFHAVRRGA
jgi:FkbM family methyltransferase